MKVCTCFLLFGIFAYTNSTKQGKSKNNDIDVKLAYANVSESSNVEYSGDTKNLDYVHTSITRETTTIDKAARVETVTVFIQEAVYIINTYKDTAFEDFFGILDIEIRRYKFSELMQNPDTRSWLAGALKTIKGKSVSFMKATINEKADMMRDKTYGNDVTELLDYINSLYRHTEQKFHIVLKELKDYSETKSLKSHKKIIKRGLRLILFDHYTELDSNTKRELKVKIEKFWNRFKNNHASKVKSKLRPISIKEDDKHEQHFSLLKPEKSWSKSKHVHAPSHIPWYPIVAEYNAEIDVQLANTELLKSLGIFKPVPDKKHATNSDLNKKKLIGLRARPDIEPKKPTALKKPRSAKSTTHDTINEYLSPLSNLRNHISNLFSKESNVVMRLMNDNNINKEKVTTRPRKETSINKTKI